MKLSTFSLMYCIGLVRDWVKRNRREALIITLILFTGAYFRLYRIDEYMTFLGDEGRDVIIVRRLLVDFDLILIGPRTSIGDMYLGPLYYYLMAPFLLFAGFNPVGPSIMVALLGIITVFLVWLVTREWFGKYAAALAALLYAINPTVIKFSKSSWNPNIMPFFALLAIFSIWKIWSSLVKSAKSKSNNTLIWMVILGISMAFVLQSHYLGLLLIPTLAVFWVLGYVNILRRPKKRLDILKKSLMGLGVFSLLMSPLVIFDWRHGWRNFESLRKFFLERQTTVSARPWTALPKLPEVANETTSSLIGAGNADMTWVYVNLSIIVLFWIFYEVLFKNKRIDVKDRKWWGYLWDKINTKPLAPYLLLITWLLVSYIGLGIYKQHIYDHYFGIFFPAPFILVSGITQYVYKRSGFLFRLVIVLFFAYAAYVNYTGNPLRHPPNRQMQRTIQVAEKIKDEAGEKKFNLAVIAERNYEDAYQYFLEKWDTGVTDIDPLNSQETITEQLFLVCELPKEQCNPTNNPKAEVANFGWSKVENSWRVGGNTIFKLIHTK